MFEGGRQSFVKSFQMTLIKALHHCSTAALQPALLKSFAAQPDIESGRGVGWELPSFRNWHSRWIGFSQQTLQPGAELTGIFRLKSKPNRSRSFLASRKLFQRNFVGVGSFRNLFVLARTEHRTHIHPELSFISLLHFDRRVGFSLSSSSARG